VSRIGSHDARRACLAARGAAGSSLRVRRMKPYQRKRVILAEREVQAKRSAAAERVAQATREAVDGEDRPERVWAPFNPSRWRGHTPMLHARGARLHNGRVVEDGEAIFNARGGGGGKYRAGRVETRGGSRKLVPDRNRPASRGLLHESPIFPVTSGPLARSPEECASDATLPRRVVEPQGSYVPAGSSDENVTHLRQLPVSPDVVPPPAGAPVGFDVVDGQPGRTRALHTVPENRGKQDPHVMPRPCPC
jgi:hypothetical protein